MHFPDAPTDNTERTQTVAYAGALVPPVWIAAYGFVPRRIVPRAAVSPPRMGMCSYVHALIEEMAAEEQDAAVVLTTACDQMRRGAELLARRCSLPIFLMNVPATWQSPEARAQYRMELERLGGFLAGLGKVVDGHTLVRPLPAASRSSVIRRNSESPNNGRVPLALVCGPRLREFDTILEVVRNNGGEIVLDASEDGERGLVFPDWEKTTGFSKSSLLDMLVDEFFAVVPDVFRRPNTVLYHWLDLRLRERKVKGILFFSYVWCDLWQAEEQRMRERFGLPLLSLRLDGNSTPNGHLASRVTAFMEMLRCG